MPTRKNSNRMDKINEELRKELSIIIDTDLKNPHITGMISVTKVKTSPDLRYARVYISLLNCKNVKEVAKDYECGVQLEKFNDIKEGDIIEAFVMKEIKR